MKKALTAIAAAALVLTACNNQPTENFCVIKGTIQGWQDADTLIISELSSMNISNVDTAVIKDGEFYFEFAPKAPGQMLYVLPLVKGEPHAAYAVICEPGTLFEMALPEDPEGLPSFSDSKSNSAWVELQGNGKKFSAMAEPLLRTLQNPSISDEEHDKAAQKIDSLNAELNKLYASYVIDNIPSFFSDLLFGEIDMFLEDSLRNTILDTMEKEGMTEMPNFSRIRTRVLLNKLTEPGKKFTDFTQTDADGNQIRLADVVNANKLTLIDFWASWCGPCRYEMPNVVKAYEQFHSKGLEIVGVSLDDNRDAWQKAVKDLGMKWIQVSDLQGWNNGAAQAYLVESIPSCVLIGQDGVIICKNLRGQELIDKIAEILK